MATVHETGFGFGAVVTTLGAVPFGFGLDESGKLFPPVSPLDNAWFRVGVGMWCLAALVVVVTTIHLLLGFFNGRKSPGQLQLGDMPLGTFPVPPGWQPNEHFDAGASVWAGYGDKPTVYRYGLEPRELTDATPIEIARPLLVLTTSQFAYATYPRTLPPFGLIPTMTLHVLFFAAAPLDGEPITLLKAEVKVAIDGDLDDEIYDARPSQHHKKGTPVPPDYRYPPIINPGETIEIECQFYVGPHRSKLLLSTPLES